LGTLARRTLVALSFAIGLGGCTRTADPAFVAGSLATGSFAASRPAADSLVVASYNIQFGEHVDQAIEDLRSDPMLAVADVILLQEMDGEGSAYIAQALGYDFVYYAAALHRKHGREFGNAVLSRWPILEHRFITLPVESSFPVSSRIAVIARIGSPVGDLLAVSLHSSTVVVDRTIRLEQFESVRDSVSSFEGPVVLGGDFNTPNYEDVRLLRERMRQRGYLHVRPPIATAHLPWWQEAFDVDADLDHFFYRHLRLRRNGVSANATASDHMPIWVVFDWESAN
jgi:endonuclease/exonuclease/phosphatase family metal-dependent hydrolase